MRATLEITSLHYAKTLNCRAIDGTIEYNTGIGKIEALNKVLPNSGIPILKLTFIFIANNYLFVVRTSSNEQKVCVLDYN